MAGLGSGGRGRSEGLVADDPGADLCQQRWLGKTRLAVRNLHRTSRGVPKGSTDPGLGADPMVSLDFGTMGDVSTAPAELDEPLTEAEKSRLKRLQEVLKTIAEQMILAVNNARLRSLMNHGRDSIYLSIDDDRGASGDRLKEIVARRFSFIHHGHSFRCTELEAALGLGQIEICHLS